MARALDPHHFAFCAWPLGYGRVGRQTYLLVDPGKIFVKDTDGKPLDRLPADLEADGWTSIDFNTERRAATVARSTGPWRRAGASTPADSTPKRTLRSRGVAPIAEATIPIRSFA